MHSSKKYIIIGEGECTEPEYFQCVENNMNDLGLSGLVSFKQIPRLEMDRNDTDIENMVAIASDYVAYCTKGILSRRLFVTLTFETACIKYSDKNAGPEMLGNNDSLLKLRKKINIELEKEKIPQYIVTKEDRDKAEMICRNIFSEAFGKKIREYLPAFPLKKIQIMPNDEVCIVHDRDFSEKWFPDEKYDKVVKKVNSLRGGPRFRLIITYPKFELWMLLHSTAFDVRSIDMPRLTDYRKWEPSPHNDYQKKPGPSVYVDKLMDENMPGDIWKSNSKKRINSRSFDTVLIKGFDKALENSRYSGFAREVKPLRNKPGTMLGVLFEEMRAGGPGSD